MDIILDEMCAPVLNAIATKCITLSCCLLYAVACNAEHRLHTHTDGRAGQPGGKKKMSAAATASAVAVAYVSPSQPKKPTRLYEHLLSVVVVVVVAGAHIIHLSADARSCYIILGLRNLATM